MGGITGDFSSLYSFIYGAVLQHKQYVSLGSSVSWVWLIGIAGISRLFQAQRETLPLDINTTAQT